MLVEQAEPGLTGLQQAEWLEQLEREHDNLRAALAWALEHGAVAQAARLGGALWRFWYLHGHLSEGQRWLESVFVQLATSTRLTQAKVSLGLGVLTWAQGDALQAQPLLDTSLALYTEEGDDFSVALALNALGSVAISQENYVQASAHFEAALVLRRHLGNTWGIAGSLISLGVLALDQGENERAIAQLTESLMLFRQLRDQRGIGTALSNLALIAYRQADYMRALTLAEESYPLMQALGNKQMIIFVLSLIGQCILAQGDSEGAQQRLIEAVALCQEINDPRLSDVLVSLGDVALARHNAYRATLIYSAVASYRESRHLPLSPLERSQQERTLAIVRDRLDTATFAAAWAAGRMLSLDQTIAEALRLTD
jgi:tetratricopeptide (TPR) repeat protein